MIIWDQKFYYLSTIIQMIKFSMVFKINSYKILFEKQSLEELE